MVDARKMITILRAHLIEVPKVNAHSTFAHQRFHQYWVCHPGLEPHILPKACLGQLSIPISIQIANLFSSTIVIFPLGPHSLSWVMMSVSRPGKSFVLNAKISLNFINILVSLSGCSFRSVAPIFTTLHGPSNSISTNSFTDVGSHLSSQEILPV